MLLDDAVGVLDATATECAHVAGMSTGGWIAQLLALDHPERIAAITFIASRPNTPGPVDADLPGHHAALMEAIMKTPDPDWSDERRGRPPRAAGQETGRGGRVRRDRRSGSRRGRGRQDHRRQVRDDQHRVRRPRSALARAARRDHRADAGAARRERPVLIGNGEALAAEIPDARLVRLSNVGHRLPAHAVPSIANELLAHTAD